MDDSGSRRGMQPLVLVVDADPMFGLMLEACLDFEGARVRSVSSMEEARTSLTGDPAQSDLTGVVIERDLPDGDGMDLLPLIAERHPGIPVVVCVELDTLVGPPGVEYVTKADLARITQILGLEPEPDHLPEDRLMHISALDIDDEDPPTHPFGAAPPDEG